MAVSALGSLTGMQAIAWSQSTSNQGRDQSFWMRSGFVGKNTEDHGRIVHKVTELTPNEGGLQAVLPLVLDLAEDGIMGDDMLDGNEEALVNDLQVIKADMIRHGVRSKGKVAEQTTVLRFRKITRGKLAFWLGNLIDELMFLTASGVAYTNTTSGATRSSTRLSGLSFASDVVAASTNRVVYAGSATSTATLTASDKMSWTFINKAKTLAARKRIKIQAEGRAMYVIVMSPEQFRDLQDDPTYQANMRSGGVRGSKNPLFNTATIVINDLVIHVHPKVYSTLDAASGSKWGAASTIDGAQALMLGAQALGMAMLGEPSWAEEPKDYGNRQGIAYGRMLGLLKPQFLSNYDSNAREDFGLISMFTAAASS